MEVAEESAKPLLVAPTIDRYALAHLLSVSRQDVSALVEVCELAGTEEIPPGLVATGLRNGGMVGRVVIALGWATLEALGHELPDNEVHFVRAELGPDSSYLLIYLSDHISLDLSQLALQLACTLAAVGPQDGGRWSERDVSKFNGAFAARR